MHGDAVILGSLGYSRKIAHRHKTPTTKLFPWLRTLLHYPIRSVCSYSLDEQSDASDTEIVVVYRLPSPHQRESFEVWNGGPTGARPTAATGSDQQRRSDKSYAAHH